MDWLAYLILGLALVLGIVASFLNFYGTLLLLIGAAAFAWMTEFRIVSWPILGLMTALFLLGEWLDFMLVAAGARRLGASRRAMVGAIIGGFLGGFLGLFLFGLGVFPGTLGGIFIGAFLTEYGVRNDLGQSLRAGTGGLLGVLGAMISKIAIFLMMAAVVGYQIYRAFLNEL